MPTFACSYGLLCSGVASAAHSKICLRNSLLINFSFCIWMGTFGTCVALVVWWTGSKPMHYTVISIEQCFKFQGFLLSGAQFTSAWQYFL